MIKLIVMDLDGTLLKTDKSISDFTKTVLNDCRRKGIKVIYATGRGGSAEERAPIEMFDGRIIMNGAVAYAGKELIYNCPVKINIARDLLIACDKYGLKTAAELSGMHYSNFNVTNEWSNITNYQITDFQYHMLDAEKLYAVIQSNTDIEFIKTRILKSLYLTVSRDKLAQIMNVEATKSKAINALAEYWDINAKEIVSFGDDLNDIDMLTQCGMGIAMGNALDEVKEVADEICDTNDNDGIAQWLLTHT